MNRPFGLVAVCMLMLAGCGDGPGEPAGLDRVVLTGREQAIANAFAAETQPTNAEDFANSLDQAFAALRARAFPARDPAKLAGAAVHSLCEELERLRGKTASTRQRQEWTSTALRTGSFAKAIRRAQALAAGKADQAQLEEAGLKGMLAATGWSSTCVLTEAQAAWVKQIAAARERPTEERGVLGLKLDRWPAVEVIPGMPAAEAGMKTGDVIFKVDGRPAEAARTLGDAAKLLAGPAGRKSRLTVKRGKETLTFEVQRQSLAASQIAARLVDPAVLYVRIPTFEGSGIAAKVEPIVRKHVAGGVRWVLLDLRDNPGGRPEEANGVADVFLDSKLLQIYQFRSGKRIGVKSRPGALAVGVIILINRNTGSGAEMLAIALQDNGRATLIGEPTAGAVFGKDIEELKNGRVIVFRCEPTVLSPKGTDYSYKGGQPDIGVVDKRVDGADDILDRAVKFARGQLNKCASP
jgi:carboxyl-terminal processing protease